MYWRRLLHNTRRVGGNYTKIPVLNIIYYIRSKLFKNHIDGIYKFTPCFMDLEGILMIVSGRSRPQHIMDYEDANLYVLYDILLYNILCIFSPNWMEKTLLKHTILHHYPAFYIFIHPVLEILYLHHPVVISSPPSLEITVLTGSVNYVAAGNASYIHFFDPDPTVCLRLGLDSQSEFSSFHIIYVVYYFTQSFFLQLCT